MARSEAATHPAGLEGLFYAWDGTKPDGERVIAERMTLNGQTIDPAASYRVTVNNFLSVGGAASPSSHREPRRKPAFTTSTR